MDSDTVHVYELIIMTTQEDTRNYYSSKHRTNHLLNVMHGVEKWFCFEKNGTTHEFTPWMGRLPLNSCVTLAKSIDLYWRCSVTRMSMICPNSHALRKPSRSRSGELEKSNWKLVEENFKFWFYIYIYILISNQCDYAERFFDDLIRYLLHVNVECKSQSPDFAVEKWNLN